MDEAQFAQNFGSASLEFQQQIRNRFTSLKNEYEYTLNHFTQTWVASVDANNFYSDWCSTNPEDATDFVAFLEWVDGLDCTDTIFNGNVPVEQPENP